MSSAKQIAFSVSAVIVIAVVVTLVAAEGGDTASDKERAVEALKAVRDLATWLALIQTGVIVALAHLYEKPPSYEMSSVRFWAGTTFLFMGASLFCTAWVLSAIPSMILRVGDGTVKDILSAHLFSWFAGKFILNRIRLEVLVSIQHTYWVLGLLSFGACVWKSKFRKE